MHLAVTASGAFPPRCLISCRFTRSQRSLTVAASLALMVFASGAGAGSAASEPRSRTPSALGAKRRRLESHGRNGAIAKRSGGPLQWGWRSENV